MRLLLVEDEEKLGKAIKRGLELEGYSVDMQTTAEDGLTFAETEEYDVMILDRMLPGGKDGLDICRHIRALGNKTPVLILTARGAVGDRVTGLKDGADDYLIKPFSFDELLARVAALLRRPSLVITDAITCGDLSLNPMTKEVLVRNKLISLSKKEFGILEYLMRNAGRVMSKEQIIQHVWDYDADILINTVEVFVRGIRKKIDKPNKPSWIETIRGFGYTIRK